jgi:hypothetical protein
MNALNLFLFVILFHQMFLNNEYKYTNFVMLRKYYFRYEVKLKVTSELNIHLYSEDLFLNIYSFIKSILTLFF